MKHTRLSVSLAVFVLGLTTAAGAAEEKHPLFEKKVYTDAQGHELPLRLLKPEHYDPKEKYPLVLFLHGAGERGTDNDKQLIHGVREFAKEENRKKYPCFVIAPQCPTGDRWADWSAKRLPDQPLPPMRLVIEMLKKAQKEYSIDPQRIYVTGLSMGGFGTFDLIERHPDWFAAAVPICGGGDVSAAPKIAKIPLWIFHGAKDKVVPVTNSRDMVEAVKKAGGHPRYTEYPDAGHDSWTATYKDPELYTWLFAQKKAAD